MSEAAGYTALLLLNWRRKMGPPAARPAEIGTRCFVWRYSNSLPGMLVGGELAGYLGRVGCRVCGLAKRPAVSRDERGLQNAGYETPSATFHVPRVGFRTIDTLFTGTLCPIPGSCGEACAFVVCVCGGGEGRTLISSDGDG